MMQYWPPIPWLSAATSPAWYVRFQYSLPRLKSPFLIRLVGVVDVPPAPVVAPPPLVPALPLVPAVPLAVVPAAPDEPAPPELPAAPVAPAAPIAPPWPPFPVIGLTQRFEKQVSP